MKVINKTKNIELFSTVTRAKSLKMRLKGLIGHSPLSSNESLWILQCNCIHTFFMSFPIDIIFINKKFQVLKVINHIVPHRISPIVWKADSIFESQSQTISKKVSKGDQLNVVY